MVLEEEIVAKVIEESKVEERFLYRPRMRIIVRTRVTAEIALYAGLRRPAHLGVKRVMFGLKPCQNVS